MPLIDEPRDWLLDKNNDLVIDADLQWTTGIQAVVQECQIALQMFEGEWFLNLDAGMPYWDEILGQKPAAALVVARSQMHEELLSIDGVVDVLVLEVTYEKTRMMRIKWQVLTEFGETPIDTLDLEVA